MDMEELMQRYPNVSREEIENIRKISLLRNRNVDSQLKSLNKGRENKKIKGRSSVEAGPLVELLSVHVIPSDKLIDRNKPLTIYGRIYVEYHDTYSGKIIVHDLFSRKCDDAQVGGPLALTGPPYPYYLPDYTPVNNKTRLVVDVFVGEGNNLFAEKQLCCVYEDMTNDMENIELDYVHGELCSLALRYIVMPFAVYAHVNVHFIYRENPDERFINVKGKLVARYGNNLNGSKCTLFEKLNDNEFERVEKHPSMRLTRCWLGVPVTSSLILDFDLSEFGTGRKILKKTIELRVGDKEPDDEFIVDDDILIQVHVGWSRLHHKEDYFFGNITMMMMMKKFCIMMSKWMSILCFCNIIINPQQPLGILYPLYPPDLFASSFVEIFSVFIGRENYKPMQVYGSIQVSSENAESYIFKRETKKDAFYLQEHSKTLPVLDCSRVFSVCSSSLKMKIDLKDVENQWHIKGYVKWYERDIEYGARVSNHQLCSVIQGQDGNFAAIHYTIFSEYEADYAMVGLLCVPKNGGHFRPKVYGSLVAQYDNYDYTSLYNKDYYRIVLFQRNRDDAAQPGPDGFIPLSRSMIVVPKDSFIVIEAKIGDGLSDELSFQELLFNVGNMDTMRKNLIMKRKLIMERNDYSIYMYVKWD
ncbi:hypothetical protein CASFOL_020979 [Castilleja foliolosa]|uniref:DUF6598 domain-containing protein n=1 Tax=Castilleja foliolosa TaxID=1961234 RepID=A0ABD3D376_9LAMI